MKRLIMKPLMRASVLACIAGAAVATPAEADATPAPLIVVEDRGGSSALPYYHALDPQDTEAGHLATPLSTTPPTPRIVQGAEAEAAMLPVRSPRLTPGTELRRLIRAPGLVPLFLIGDDERSRTWLRERRAMLQDMQAVGLVVHVATPAALAALRAIAPGLLLSPVSGDDLAQRLGIRHYPVLITATGVEP